MPLEEGDSTHSEDYAMLPDGAHIYQAMKFPLRDATGTIYGVGGISTDVTTLKRTAEALRSNQALLQGIMDNSPAAIFVKDYDGRFLLVNSNTSQLVGLTPDELVGRIDAEVFPPENTFKWRKAEHAVWESRKVLVSRDTADFPDGTHYYLSVKFPLFDRDGNIYATGAISTDITDIVRAEEERAQFQQQIIAAQQQALHEISTPLIPIARGVVVMPLIGSIDSNRAQQVLETLLEGIAHYQAEIVLLDITGVRVVDSQIASTMLRAARAVKLLGASVRITGIQPAIAQTLVRLGVDLADIQTHSTLETGIAAVLRLSANGRGSLLR
ncbi:MAG: PAS domain-containing protein [Chloroflexaceae bacterium]|nr:PAS domain-containing protein [Chloroflexaceae bacterium]